MDIEAWIAGTIAEIGTGPLGSADTQELPADLLWTLQEPRLADRATPLGLRDSSVVQFRPELQRAANLDHVHLIQV